MPDWAINKLSTLWWIIAGATCMVFGTQLLGVIMFYTGLGIVFIGLWLDSSDGKTAKNKAGNEREKTAIKKAGKTVREMHALNED